MSRIDSTDTAASASNTLVGNSIEDLNLDVFLDLMLTQLQNQDPLNPMENDEMLNTISQIREISANDKLSETLESVLLGQNVTTATSLIGTEVEALTDSGQRVTGEARNVVINDGEAMVEVAVAPTAEAAEDEGQINSGTYLYEIAWESEDVTYSVQVPVDTDQLGEDFNGSIRIDHLPDTGDVPKHVYRTDRTGTGDLQLIGKIGGGGIGGGGATSFVDTLRDSDRQSTTLTGSRQVLGFADAVEVRLSNIARVNTLE